MLVWFTTLVDDALLTPVETAGASFEVEGLATAADEIIAIPPARATNALQEHFIVTALTPFESHSRASQTGRLQSREHWDPSDYGRGTKK